MLRVKAPTCVYVHKYSHIHTITESVPGCIELHTGKKKNNLLSTVTKGTMTESHTSLYVTAKLFVTHMYSIDRYPQIQCICQRNECAFSYLRNWLQKHVFTQYFLLFSLLGPWSHSAMCVHSSVGYSSQNHHAYASTIYREMGKQRGGGSVPLLASFETRCVIRRPTTSLATIKNSSQAGAEGFIFTQQKWSHHTLLNGVHCGFSGRGGMLGNIL